MCACVCVCVVRVCVCLCASCPVQGLDTTVLQRIHQWHFTGPCEAVHGQYDSGAIDTGLLPALLQLGPALPAGSHFVALDDEGDPYTTLAAAPRMPPGTTLWPRVWMDDATDAQPMAVYNTPFENMYISSYESKGPYCPAVPWSWQRARMGLHCSRFLYLPDPTGGQYELELDWACFCPYDVSF